MSQELENQSNVGSYVDPIANAEQMPQQKPEKKQGKAAGILSIVGTVVMYRLFGLVGGLICLGGFAAVTAIIKSKLPTAAKVVLSVLTVVGFVVLLFAFIMLSAAIMAE